jgi:hypothetical protein
MKSSGHQWQRSRYNSVPERNAIKLNYTDRSKNTTNDSEQSLRHFAATSQCDGRRD